MKILLLAPHPFYQDRGTPIAVDLLVRALAQRGDSVDVLTYHEGQDRQFAGPGLVRIFRIKRPPFCRNIRPGFSAKKLIADAYMHREAMRLAKSFRYDIVHAVEESVFMAKRIRNRYRIPYVFDMDSSMPEQIVEKMPYLRPLLGFMRMFERSGIRRAAAVAAVCDSLADVARNAGAGRISILRDVPLLDSAWNHAPPANGFRKELGIEGLCLLYIGNLEKYQGIDLMMESFARVPVASGAHLVIVGGVPDHIAFYRRKAEHLGIADRTQLVGPRPISDMPALMDEADILVSPRIKGTNTPMKIYSYMASGKAIIATNLFTHTQVLDAKTACLAAPTPDAFGNAMTELLADALRRKTLGSEARRAVETRYSLDVFQKTVNDLYSEIAKDIAAK